MNIDYLSFYLDDVKGSSIMFIDKDTGARSKGVYVSDSLVEEHPKWAVDRIRNCLSDFVGQSIDENLKSRIVKRLAEQMSNSPARTRKHPALEE